MSNGEQVVGSIYLRSQQSTHAMHVFTYAKLPKRMYVYIHGQRHKNKDQAFSSLFKCQAFNLLGLARGAVQTRQSQTATCWTREGKKRRGGGHEDNIQMPAFSLLADRLTD